MQNYLKQVKISDLVAQIASSRNKAGRDIILRGKFRTIMPGGGTIQLLVRIYSPVSSHFQKYGFRNQLFQQIGLKGTGVNWTYHQARTHGILSRMGQDVWPPPPGPIITLILLKVYLSSLYSTVFSIQGIYKHLCDAYMIQL